ncbi:hypothetical protein [Paenibacillus campinasensis]|uniref:Uncharacterized protein n=1 Tax=Paenibacillus campinasensis TaxID=66347 RepID=A0A268EL95_9BACL|nr:hypothetical protein [Paenibacillus campinasensis]PAD73890.1 hypothetical protein CHH67_18815 [Paenibacillus campinasensis]
MDIHFDKRTILAEDGDRLLVRIEGELELDSATFRTCHHEIWTDRQKYEAGIHVERADNGLVHYSANLAGYTDEYATQIFKRGNGPLSF